MKHYILIVLSLISISILGQDKRDYHASLKSALHIHDTASSYNASMVAVTLLETTAKNNPEEWLANYWAAYIATQLGLYPDRPADAGKILPQKAQLNLEQARMKYKGDSKAIISDLHALQSFVYQYHLWYDEFSDKKDHYISKAKEEGRLALKYNPDNPLMYVLIGTGKVRSDKIEDVVAGRALLYQANAKFKLVNEHRALTTHWNEEWLRFRWLKYADERLSELVN